MSRVLLAALSTLLIVSGIATGQEAVSARSAIVALTDDPELRRSFEDQMVTTALAYRYDAVVSYDIVPDIQNMDRRRIAAQLEAEGIQVVLMLRPAAIGAGSSLESVRNEVDPAVYESMRVFAREVSESGSDDLIAVVHMAIYTLADGEARLLSSGAVWLDEEVETQGQGIERLQGLIVANVNAARPAIRERLGLPPL
ncbi:MAG TPA: hypothetical protein VMR74_13595 [Gammaproteobacteria bacterium]|nr:hypothetical protein [Gammaproteobacteria bacterium]